MSDRETGIDIKQIREELGISKYHFAKMVGVSWNTLHLWERGVYKPKMVHMEKILDVLNQYQR